MIRRFWLALSCAVILSATLRASSAAQPDHVLPPPPGAAPTITSDKTQAPSPVQAPAAAAPQTVTCTVMVPQVTYKTVTVPAIQMRPEQRQQEVTVCRMVPETQMVSCTATVVVRARRTTQQTFN